MQFLKNLPREEFKQYFFSKNNMHLLYVLFTRFKEVTVGEWTSLNPPHWFGIISSLKRPIANLTPGVCTSLILVLWRGYLQAHLLIEAKKKKNCFHFQSIAIKTTNSFLRCIIGMQGKTLERTFANSVLH